MTRPRRAPRSTSRPGLDDPRYKAARARLKTIGSHICHWCGWPIDLQLAYPHPLSWSCDHNIPRSQLAPHDERNWHISNMLEAHLRCNQARGARPPRTQGPPPPLNTSIEW